MVVRLGVMLWCEGRVAPTVGFPSAFLSQLVSIVCDKMLLPMIWWGSCFAGLGLMGLY